MKHNTFTPTLLSTLWIYVLFNIIFRDLHQFLNPVAVQALMTQNIPENQVLLYGILLEIPISMVVLSKVLPHQFNKWTNTLAGLFTGLGFLSTLPKADADDIFFITMQTIAVIGILYFTWQGPEKQFSKIQA